MGYNMSTYYMYGIVGIDGKESTEQSLLSIPLSWYQQYIRPNGNPRTFSYNDKTIFGGPLHSVHYDVNAGYEFFWYHNTRYQERSITPGYWQYLVLPSTCVAVIRAHE